MFATMTRTTRLVLIAVCVFTLGVLPHPLNEQTALAFTPTPKEACCLAVLNGNDATICGDALPSENDCKRILEDMGSAAARHRENINKASEHAKKTGAQVRHANADDVGNRRIDVLSYAGIAILVFAFIYASSLLNRTRLKGIFTCAVFLLNLAVFITVLLYIIIAFLCRIGDSCATTNLLLVYVTLSIPIGVVLLTAIFIKYLRSANQTKMSATMLLFNLIVLAAIFIFKIGTSA